MSRQIPDRWILYKAFGKVIEGTRIICFKVPLRKIVQRNAAVNDIWDIDTLLSSIPEIGGVIDLTNTLKYYDPQKLRSKGVLYKKILVEGRQLPPEKSVIEFMNTVDDFLNKDKNCLVGVHCTHGLNRTGYMVCRYMKDRLGVPPKDAIQKFQIARGYQIERDNYIAQLLGDAPLPPNIGKQTILKPTEDSASSTSSYEYDSKYDY